MKRKYIIVITYILVVVLGFDFVLTAAKDDKEILFPKREYVKKVSQTFFKQVNLTLPLVEKVDFFARSEAYPSAYLALSPYLVKHVYLNTLFSFFETDNGLLLESFQSCKREITLDNYSLYPGKLSVGQFRFYVLALYTLSKDFQANRLSGAVAFQLWNVILRMTESALKAKNNTIDNAAILTVSAHLIFFKSCKKWQKKAQKLLKKLKPINPDTIIDKEIGIVLKNIGQ